MPLHLLAKSGEMKRSGSQVSVILKQGHPCSSPSEVDGDPHAKNLLGRVWHGPTGKFPHQEQPMAE